MTCLLLAAVLIGPLSDLEAADDIPVGTEAKAVITDVHGQPLPTEMPLGEAVVFSARRSIRGNDPRAVKWTITPPERDSRKYVSPDGLEVFVPTGSVDVTITAILSVALDNTTDHLAISVKCGKGAQPPPPPPDPKPKPPPTPTARHLHIVVAFDALSPTVDDSIIRNSTNYWRSLTTAGHSWRFIDKSTPEAAQQDAGRRAKAVEGPAVILYDKDTDEYVTAAKLPKSLTELDKFIQQYVVK